jgi:hypothetical protein
MMNKPLDVFCHDVDFMARLFYAKMFAQAFPEKSCISHELAFYYVSSKKFTLTHLGYMEKRLRECDTALEFLCDGDDVPPEFWRTLIHNVEIFEGKHR